SGYAAAILELAYWHRNQRRSPSWLLMKRHMTLRGSAPALLAGLVMLGACAFGVRAINQLRSSLAGILNQNVASLRAAQDLEIKLRQLRFHFLTYVVDPTEERSAMIQADQKGF